MYQVTIFNGPHYTDPVALQYQAIGSESQLLEGAKVKVRQHLLGKRVWVNLDKLDGTPVTHWNIEEHTHDL